jgi:hypothetical protein
MTVMNLESLVLCGVSVLCDGQASNPRLGTGYTGMDQATTIGQSMQHPSSDPLPLAAPAGGRKWQAFDRPAGRIEPAVADRVADAEVGGTGRSQVHAGLSASCQRVSSTSRARAIGSSSGQTQAPLTRVCGRSRLLARKS